MKMIFLEGMPLVGKTTIIETIKNRSINGVFVVNEIILSTENYCQEFFMENDIAKINMYNDGIIVVDRGLISTLSYNMALKKIYKNNDYNKVVKWFKKYGINLYSNSNVITYYLKGNKYNLRYNNTKNPYGSKENQKVLENITINNIKKYCLNYKIIEYDYNNMEDLLSEIIS